MRGSMRERSGGSMCQTGGSTTHQLVWGGVHLLERPAAAERMTAVLFAHSLHNRDHQGASELTVLSDGTYAAGELDGLTRSPEGAYRGLSGGVHAIYFLRARPDEHARASLPTFAKPSRPASATARLADVASARGGGGSAGDSSDDTVEADGEGSDEDEPPRRLTLDGGEPTPAALAAYDDDDSTPVAESDGDESDGAPPTGGGGGGGGGGAVAVLDEADVLNALALDVSVMSCGGGRPSPAVLHPNDVVVVQTEAQIFVWCGGHALAYQRWAGATLGRCLAARQVEDARRGGLPVPFPLCRTVQGAEPAAFTALFAAWDATINPELHSQLAHISSHATPVVEWPMSDAEAAELFHRPLTCAALDLGDALGRAVRTAAAADVDRKAQLAIWQMQPTDDDAEHVQILPKEVRPPPPPPPRRRRAAHAACPSTEGGGGGPLRAP